MQDIAIQDEEERRDDEQARIDLAVRMLGHEARTHIITFCTGLSQDRIRKIWCKRFRSAGAQHRGARRRRGKSPSSIEFFMRNPWIQAEASLLAHILAHWSLLRILPDLSTLPAPCEDRLELGERFCAAFEEFQSISPDSRISFEHAWSLLATLTERDDLLLLLDCAECRSIYVHDALALDARRCPACRVGPRREGGRGRGRGQASAAS